jgi:hypothetical protein
MLKVKAEDSNDGGGKGGGKKWINLRVRKFLSPLWC